MFLSSCSKKDDWSNMEEEKTEPRPPVSTQEILQVNMSIIYSMHDLFLGWTQVEFEYQSPEMSLRHELVYFIHDLL